MEARELSLLPHSAFSEGGLGETHLPLDAAAADAGHDVLAQEDEHQEQGQGHQGYGGHLHAVLLLTPNGLSHLLFLLRGLLQRKIS